MDQFDSKKHPEAAADTAGELRVRLCMQRKALAFQIANIATSVTIDAFISKLFLTRRPITGYRSVDKAITDNMDSAEITYHPLPMRDSSSSKVTQDDKGDKPDKRKKADKEKKREVVNMNSTNSCTAFQAPDYRGCTQQPPHVQGAHYDAQLLGSCQRHSCPSIGFLQLGEDFLLWKLFHTPAPPSAEKPDLCLRQENKVSGHPCTRCNTLRLNSALRLGSPFRIAKCGDHLITVVQDGKTTVRIRAEDNLALEPINSGANVLPGG